MSTFESDDSATDHARGGRRCFEFTRPYLGGETIPKQLHEYITSCAHKFADAPVRFPFPSISIVQSSGFGKSRLLRELAHRTKDDPDGTMKVLYTCVRAASGHSSAYPEPTVCLRDYLFPPVDQNTRGDLVQELTTKLFRLYDYAATHWDSVGQAWSTLFDNQADSEICEKLKSHTVGARTAPATGATPRILVLAIDDARNLFKTYRYGYDAVGWYKRFRSALITVSYRIRIKHGRHAVLFAVLVDSSTQIIARYDDPEAVGRGSARESELFPPFVLTQTTDIRFEELVHDAKRKGLSSNEFYQQLVGCEYDEAWSKLVLMGRPSWDRVDRDDWNKKEAADRVIKRAADKLLHGRPPPPPMCLGNFDQDSRFGVASVFCRLGLQPSSWSQLASQAVAEFLATLVHVTVSHDQFVITYTSEPVLTFGAACVWYRSATSGDPHACLAEHILPHFRRSVLSRDTLSTSGKHGDLVGRFLLLLTMDATGDVVSPSDYSPLTGFAREYAGQFHSVEVFLGVMYGDHPLVVRDGKLNDVTRTFGASVRDMLQGWREWKVGFSHFLQVTTEPSEDELWAMLARRAAGVFAHSYDDVDLFIPIFNGTAVSMILIQTATRPGGELPLVARLMRPSSLFSNAFSQQSPSAVVRIFFQLSEAAGEPFFYGDRLPTGNASFVMCRQGLQAWSALRVADQCEPSTSPSARIVPVVSDAVARELRKLLEPWWETASIIEEDEVNSGSWYEIRHHVIQNISSRPSIDALLKRDWPTTIDSEQTSASASAAAEATTVAVKRKRRKRRRRRSVL